MQYCESKIMSFLRRFGLQRLAWSLRRLYCPVSKEALVLEVGSGGNPYYRSNVLLDAYESTRERHWVPLRSDRLTVLGFVENLPFKDKSFDFVIASHVLEHSSDPEKFLNELQRVAKAGYIEVPDAFMERINPYRDHRLEITVRTEKLIIRKKPASTVDSDLVELYSDRAKKIIANKVIPTNPFDFHVRFYWENKINFEVINNDIDCSWIPPNDKASETVSVKKTIRQYILDFLRWIMSQSKRNASLKITDLLQCPECNVGEIVEFEHFVKCTKCGMKFSNENKIPRLFVKIK